MDLGPVQLYNKLKPVLGHLAYTASTHIVYLDREAQIPRP